MKPALIDQEKPAQQATNEYQLRDNEKSDFNNPDNSDIILLWFRI
jgi:hypothetical protein